MTDAALPPPRTYAFVSYWSGERAEVERVIAAIEARGLTVWYDRDIAPGAYEPQIMQAITNAFVFVGILSEGGVGPASSGWVADEIQRARSDGVPVILPCIVGDFAMPAEIESALGSSGGGVQRDGQALQRIAVDRVEDLTDSSTFLGYLDHTRDRIAGRPTRRIRDYLRDARPAPEGYTVETEEPEDVAAWYNAGHGFEDQALALAVATLPDISANIVVEVGADLARAIEAGLRPETEAEQEKHPRAIGTVSRSQRLTRIRARMACIRDPGDGRRVDVIRFEDPNRRFDLMRHVWSERDDVRAAFMGWVDRCLDDAERQDLGHAVGRSLGLLAQEQLDSFLLTVVRPWLARGRDLRRLAVLSDILSSAVERADTIQTISRLLVNHVETDAGVALWLAGGDIGLRRPEIFVAVLRKVGRRAFADDALLRIVLRVAVLGGARGRDDRLTGSGAPDLGADDAPEDGTSGTNGTKPGETTAPAADALAQPEHAAGIAAARVLAALGAWVDARVPPRDPKAKLVRQTALIPLLIALGRLGPGGDSDGTANGETKEGAPARGDLDLELLVGPIATYDPSILCDILRGLARAVAARPVRGWHYRAPNHLRRVLRGLAREARAKGETRALEKFAGWLHAEVAQHYPDRVGYVVDPVQGILPDASVALIRTEEPFKARIELP